MKIKTFKVLIVTLLTIGLASASIVFAASTIGTNISTDGSLTADGALQFVSGSANNYILKSDASGNATWVSVGSALSGAGLGVGDPGGIAPLDLSSLVPMANLPVGFPGGLATLDGGGRVPIGQLPTFLAAAVSFQGTWDANTNSPALTLLSNVTGDYYVVSVAGSTDPGCLVACTTWDVGDWAVFNGTNWGHVPGINTVASVFGRTGAVVAASGDYAKADITGLADGDSPTFAGLTLTSGALGINGVAYLFPAADGTVGQVLTTDGSQNLTWTTPAASFTDPMTTRGDIIVRDPTNITNRLPLGGAGQVLTSDGTDINWATPSSSFANPMTTLGDIIYGAIGGTATRLAGSAGFLKSTGAAAPTWSAVDLASSDITGTLAITNGGTGAITASGARTALSAAVSGANGDITSLTGLTTALSETQGGTGQTTYSTGDLLYASGANTLSKLIVGSIGDVLTVAGGVPTWATPANNGTVTSVALALPSIFSVSGSPVTTSGTLTGSLATQTANTIFSGPSSGGPASPTFRALGATDIPSLDTSKITSGTFAEAFGGTNQSTYSTGDLLYASGANTLAKRTIGSSGDVLTVSGGVPTWVTPAGSGITSLNGLTGLTQTFATGTAGSDFNISSSSTTHTFNIPDATSSKRGLLLPTDWTIFNNKASSGANGDITSLTGLTTALSPTQGGTNQTTYSTGDTLYASAANTLSKLTVGSAGQVLTVSGGVPTWATPANNGTVTSVALALPSIFSVSGSPVTTSGTLTGSLATQTANTIFSGPSSGGPASPTFRVLGATDIPNLDASKITTGAIAAANGGTGQTSYAIGDLLYASGATTLSKLADVATGNVLRSGGVGVAPAWGKVALGTDISGTLPIANGGTNSTATPTAGGISYGTGSAYAFTAAGTSGQSLKSNAAGAPTWITEASVTSSPADPTGTTSTTQVMMGLGGGASITPTKAGKILITISGTADHTLSATSGSVGCQIQARYGTGTAPANGAAASGTTVGQVVLIIGGHANERLGFTTNGVVTGLSVGTAHWIDLGVAENTATAGTCSVDDINISAIEF